MELQERYLLQKGPRQEDVKKAFLIFRWLLIIVCATMVVFSQNLLVDIVWAHLFVILIILSNAGLHLVPARIVTQSSFYSAVAITDIGVITLGLIISGQTATDFYLLYFLVLMISALNQQMTRVVISTVLVILLYGLTLLLTNAGGETDPAVLLRFPFFFIIALFYGFLVQSLREDKQREDQLAQDEVNRIKVQFLGSITHELLGPINMIMGHIHLLLTGAAGNLTLEQIRILDQFQFHAEKLLKFIRELVELSNIETKRLDLQVRKGDIKPFLQDLQLELEPRLKDKPLRAEVLCDDGLPPVETDWTTFRHAMMHILANTIASSESGQITVMADGANTEEATFVVLNTSSSVTKETIPSTLERLRHSGALLYDGNGMGIGLAIAKNLLDLLGARIQVAPGTSKNPDFVISVPVRWGTRPKKVVGLSYVEPFRQRE